MSRTFQISTFQIRRKESLSSQESGHRRISSANNTVSWSTAEDTTNTKTLASRKSSILRADTAPQFSLGIVTPKRNDPQVNLSVNSSGIRPKSVNSTISSRPSWSTPSSMVQLQFNSHNTPSTSANSTTTSSSSNSPPPTNLIFAPPNLVDDTQKSTNGSNYPKKTAGDVSLLGPQLIPFLMKAASRLPEVKCEGVKLRLRQFEQLIAGGDNFSEAFLKKMNFIVDSLDRGSYEEAWQYFEQLTVSFPQETASGWAHGLRLLISELKQGKKKQRASSAGLIKHLN